MLSMIFLIIGGCKKKETQQCYNRIMERPFYFKFVAYPQVSSYTVFVERYTANSNFSKVEKIDTIQMYIGNSDTSNLIISSGSDRPYEGENNKEYKIYLYGEKDTFIIKDIKYNIDDEWKVKKDCPLVKDYTVYTSGINLNGSLVKPDDNQIIYLKK